MEISSFFITSSITIVVTLFKKSDSKGFFLNQGREVQDIYMNILSPVL